MSPQNWLWLTAGMVGAPLLIWGLFRLYRQLKARGYLVDPSQGGGGGLSGAGLEMDRFIRPAIEHVVASREAGKLQVQHSGDPDRDS